MHQEVAFAIHRWCSRRTWQPSVSSALDATAGFDGRARHIWQPCMAACRMFCIRWKLQQGAQCMQGSFNCSQIAAAMSVAMTDAAVMPGSKPMQQVWQALHEDIWEARSSRHFRCCVSPLILRQECARWDLAHDE